MDEFYQNEEKLYQFLKIHLPSNIRSLLYKCSNWIESLRKQILLQQRMVHSYSLLSISHYPKKHVPEQNKLVDFIFNHFQYPISSSEIPSEFIQDASIFIPYVYDNLGNFARAVIRCEKSQYFDFIINSSIPSIFGNFSSDEYTKLASVFYTHVVGEASPELAIQILAPFFQSLPTFRFIECVMTPFSIHYGSEIRLRKIAKSLNSNTEYNKSAHSISVQLLGFIKKSLPLIPSTHIVLLNLMKSLRWSQGHINYFFFHQFFIHEAKKWIESSPYAGNSDFFNQICKDGFTLDEMTKITSNLSKVTSLYELPCLCQTAGQSFLLLCTSPFDIVLIAKVFLKESKDPKIEIFRQQLKLTQIDENVHYKSLWLRVFPTSVGKSMMPNPDWNYSEYKDADVSSFFHNKRNIFPIFIRKSFTSEKSDTNEKSDMNEKSGICCSNSNDESKQSNSKNKVKIIDNKNENNLFNDGQSSSQFESNSSANFESSSCIKLGESKSVNDSNFSTDTFIRLSDLSKNEVSNFNSLYSAIERDKSINNLTVYDSIIETNTYTCSLKYEEKEKFKCFALNKNLKSLLTDVGKFEKYFIFEVQRKIVEENLLRDSCSLYDSTFALVAVDKDYEFLTNRLKCIQILSHIRPYLIAVQKRFEKEFHQLAKLWKNFTEEAKEYSPTSIFKSLSEQKRILFWECVEQLKTLVIVPLIFRLEVFNDVMNKIQLIKNKKEFIFNVLIMTNNEKIITSFSLFSSCLMKCDIFKNLFNDDLISMWVEFESTFLSYLSLSKDRRLSSLFINIQSMLEDAISPTWHSLKTENDSCEIEKKL